jgi:hypothetical protein
MAFGDEKCASGTDGAARTAGYAGDEQRGRGCGHGDWAAAGNHGATQNKGYYQTLHMYRVPPSSHVRQFGGFHHAVQSLAHEQALSG